MTSQVKVTGRESHSKLIAQWFATDSRAALLAHSHIFIDQTLSLVDPRFYQSRELPSVYRGDCLAVLEDCSA